MLLRAGRFVMTITLVSIIGGCHTTGLPKAITREQLQTHGVIAGSFLTTIPEAGFLSGGNYIGDRRFILTSLDTDKQYAIEIGTLKDKDIVDQATDMTGAPFACVVPAGRYKFDGWYVELRSGGTSHQLVKKYWSNASVPVSIAPGEMKYIGRLSVPIDKSAFVFKRASASSDRDDRCCVVQNSAHDDLQKLAVRYPNLPWSETVVSMDLLNLEEADQPSDETESRWARFVKTMEGPQVPVKFARY